MSNEREARMHIAQAYSRAISPSTREHCRAALRLLDGGDDLAECPDCGSVGVAERIAEGACCEATDRRGNAHSIRGP